MKLTILLTVKKLSYTNIATGVLLKQLVVLKMGQTMFTIARLMFIDSRANVTSLLVRTLGCEIQWCVCVCVCVCV